MRIFTHTILSLLTASMLCFAAHASEAEQAESTYEDMVMDFTFETVDGGTFSLAEHRGKALLVVNTASRCGFTDQYSGMQQLWDEYRDQGLMVVAVPSNDFGSQEPLEGGAIKQFCETNYDTTFPIMAKVHVKGDQAHPFYQHVRERFGFTGAPKWNFHKYLIDADGNLVDWFSSITSPKSKKLVAAIKTALPEQRNIAQND